MTLLWDRLCFLQQNFVTVEGSKSLLRFYFFYKHLHFCEISDKLHVHCDIQRKNNLSYPAITI